MLLLAMTSQAVKYGAFLFAADRRSYFRPMASLCASGEAFYPNSTGVGGILVASDSGLLEDFFRRRSSWLQEFAGETTPGSQIPHLNGDEQV
jgi:hypothetical protein